MNLRLYLVDTINIPFQPYCEWQLQHKAKLSSDPNWRNVKHRETNKNLQYPEIFYYPYMTDWMCIVLDYDILQYYTFKHMKSRDTPSNWDISRCTKLSGNFSGSDMNFDLSYWDVSNVTVMRNTFRYIRTVYKRKMPSGLAHTINNWKPLSLRSMNATFLSTNIFMDPRVDISGWKTPELRNLSRCFANSYFPITQLRNWDVGKVTSYSMTFLKSSAIIKLSDIISLKFKPSANCYHMFKGVVITGYGKIGKIPGLQGLNIAMLNNSHISGSDMAWVIQNFQNPELSQEKRKFLSDMVQDYNTRYDGEGIHLIHIR